MIQETHLSFAPIFRAIRYDDYSALRDELQKPSFDINQSITRDQPLREGITLNEGHTPMSYAISLGEPSLVELFLLMGANPYGGHDNLNPIQLINEQVDLTTNTRIKTLLLQSQHPEQPVDESQLVNKHKFHFNGPFIEAITSGDDVTVRRMLSDGLIYTDQCCYNLISTALTLAVKSTLFNTVALLVELGATISNNEVRLLLEKHSQ